jgi:recombination protein RecT
MNAPATQSQSQQSPIVQLRRDIKAALPSFGLKDEREQQRMSSVLMVAVERDHDLVFADRQSLIAAVRQCANHGLVPDGNEATLQVYNTKVKTPEGQEKWIKKVQYQPMVRGIINRVQKSGKVLSFWAEVVYEGEDFQVDASDGERRPIHKITNHFNRGTDKQIIGAYSVAKLKNGTVDCEPMPRSEIEKVRGVAKTKKVWDGWFSEKAKVAVMRRHSKRLPLSAEDLDMILNREEHDFDQQEIRDVTPEAKPNLAQRLQQQNNEEAETPEQEPGQPINGEILPPEEDATDEPQIDPSELEFAEGVSAANDSKAVTDCPYGDDQLVQKAHWLAGFKQQSKLNAEQGA